MESLAITQETKEMDGLEDLDSILGILDRTRNQVFQILFLMNQ